MSVRCGERLSLSFYPFHYYAHGIVLFFGSELMAFLYSVPFLKTSAATASCGVLGYEYRMATHGSLFAVVGYDFWSKAFANKVLSVAAYSAYAFTVDIFNVALFQSETASECRL